ncbi:uncharacterized protein LOC134822984 [Bolinopsis microptera]|uniref:uncharacterized protein LOC134822984 n=1 Tax=Bolinopsis microptera TaxID=2820187 RepID=UPI00307ACDCC
MQDHSRRGSRHSSGGDGDPLGLSTSSTHSSTLGLTARFRRSSSGGSTPNSTESGRIYIAGNMLLSMIDKGCDGELTSQLMLRYGFISPVISDSITSRDMSHKQVFYSQEKYRFSDKVVRAVSRLATISSARSRKPSVMMAAVNRRLSQEISPDQKGSYTTLPRTKEYVLEKPNMMTLDKPHFFTMKTPTVHESRVINIQSNSRRLSMAEPKKLSLLEKFRKTSK